MTRGGPRKQPPDQAPTLGDLFYALQAELISGLAGNKRILKHPTIKGDASELRWQEMLAAHLPSRYELARGSVIGADGRASDQIDILIFDRQYTPKLFRRDSALYVPAESVYAAIEVKQDFTKSNLLYAAKKVASVRNLHRTTRPVRHAGGIFKAVQPARIIGGVVALASGWKPPFGAAFRRAVASLRGAQQLDLGCALTDGAFNFDGKNLLHSTGDRALVEFFVSLFGMLQDVGTVPALDLGAYLDHAGK